MTNSNKMISSTGIDVRSSVNIESLKLKDAQMKAELEENSIENEPAQKEMNFEDKVKYVAEMGFSKTERFMLRSGMWTPSMLKLIKLHQISPIDNEFIDTLMALKPERMQGETYHYYKQRQKVQKLFLKHRSLVYNYDLLDSE